jgi:large subunit ribosomal protein L23
MTMNPYKIVFNRHVTEKARVQEQLQFNSSNPCVKKCQTPKYVFVVDKKATKHQIAKAIEEIYADKKIKVTSINTINVKEKERRVRGRIGYKSAFKKAIVTLVPGDTLDDNV